MKDLGLKAFALLIAVLLAVYVNSERNTSQIGIVVAVELTNIPKDRILLEPLNPRAQITVKGPRFMVAQVPQSPPEIRIKVPTGVGGSFPVSLRDQHIALPLGVQLVSIEPPQIEFKFDEMLSREVPVVVPRIGSLRDSLVLEQLTIQPDKVVVSGPAGLVRSLSRLESEPIDMRELRESDSRQVLLRLPSPLIEAVPAMLSLTVALAPRQGERTFNLLPVEIRAQGASVIIVEPAVVTVEVSGPLAALAALEKNQIVPYIRVSADGDLPPEVEVHVELPDAIALVSVEPERVRVRNSVKPVVKGTRSDPPRGKGKPAG